MSTALSTGRTGGEPGGAGAPHRSGEPSESESAAESGGRGAATAKNRALRKRRGRRTQNRAAHRLPPWNCAAPHFCLFVRNFANRRRKKFRRYRFTAQERRRTEAANRAARERRRNAAAGVRERRRKIKIPFRPKNQIKGKERKFYEHRLNAARRIFRI